MHGDKKALAFTSEKWVKIYPLGSHLGLHVEDGQR